MQKTASDIADIRYTWNRNALIEWVTSYPRTFMDWAFLSSYSAEGAGGNGIDMLNSEYCGWLGYAGMAKQIGNTPAEHFGIYATSRSFLSAMMRMHYPTYLKKSQGPNSPAKWKRPVAALGWGCGYPHVMTAQDLQGKKIIEGAVVGVSHLFDLGVDMWETSKGIAPEYLELFRKWTLKQAVAYETMLWKTQPVFKAWTRLAARSAFTSNLSWLEDQIRLNSEHESKTPKKMSFRMKLSHSHFAIMLENHRRLKAQQTNQPAKTQD